MQNLLNSKYVKLYAYGIIFILCFIIMAGQDYRLEPGNDDVYHTQVVEKFGSSYNFMLDQYNNWNSRYFTSFIMAFIMDKNIWLWRILSTFVLFALIIYSSKIVQAIYNLDKRKYIIALFGIFATFALLSTGVWTQSITWVTGSFNYLYPATALVISMYYLLNSTINKEKIKSHQFVILIPVIIFACNTEQTALICVTLYSIAIFYYIFKDKYFDKYIFILYLIAIISTIIIFIAPAVSIRYIAEISRWYPVFNELSIMQKIVQGFPYTVLHGLLLNNYTETILLSVLLFIIIRQEYSNKIYSIFSLIPAIYSLIYYVGRVNTELLNSIYVYNLRPFSEKYLTNNLNEPFISVIIGTFILLILIYFLFQIKWSSFERKYLALLFFGAALMSAFILSFSPTIYASDDRIWFIPFVMYTLGIGMVFIESLKYIDINSKKIVIIFSIYVLVGIIYMTKVLR